MEAFLVSTAAVAIAELGDKTQLLTLVLAARYRRLAPLVAGIAVATVLNHALAGWLGSLLASWLSPQAQRWAIAASFLAVAVWALVPDRLDTDAQRPSRFGAFLATTVAFFVAEIGDKTQIATVVMAARYEALAMVVAGSTLGMLAANVPVALLGARFTGRLPLGPIRLLAAAVFVALAATVLLR